MPLWRCWMISPTFLCWMLVEKLWFSCSQSRSAHISLNKTLLRAYQERFFLFMCVFSFMAQMSKVSIPHQRPSDDYASKGISYHEYFSLWVLQFPLLKLCQYCHLNRDAIHEQKCFKEIRKFTFKVICCNQLGILYHQALARKGL